MTITATGYAPVTWIGVNGVNLTIPIRRFESAGGPDRDGQRDDRGLGQPAGAGRQPPDAGADRLLAGRPTLGDRANELPQGTRNVTRRQHRRSRSRRNLCVINAAVSDCNWTLTTRTGAQALLAIIVDQFNNNTPDDDTDDTFAVTRLRDQDRA